MRLPLALVLAITACHAAPATPTAPAPARAPLTLTYLGVAGWQLEADGHTLLLDPYFSRPDLDGPVVPDAAAIAARTPPRVDAILIGHSHVDHLLDAPTIARAEESARLEARRVREEVARNNPWVGLVCEVLQGEVQRVRFDDDPT